MLLEKRGKKAATIWITTRAGLHALAKTRWGAEIRAADFVSGRNMASTS